MNIRLIDLVIKFKKEQEQITFSDFNYFYGQMGAGKSTIARLIDYCFGGDLAPTPALQSEFVSVSLFLKVNESEITLNREFGSNQIRVQWIRDNEPYETMIPARIPAGEIIPGTDIEILSDMFFYLSGKISPKVRRSKLKEDSELERLSLRDLLWYCYLDQDTMDSLFFNLDKDANVWKQLKSRDVLRFLIGFHQEYVSELEIKLEIAKQERIKCEAGATAIKDALSSAEIANPMELSNERGKIEAELKITEDSIEEARSSLVALRSHEMDTLQTKARELSQQIDELKETIRDVRELTTKDKAHKNELLSLATRFRRSQSAREILISVQFTDCPSCGKTLPNRTNDLCLVCGQVHSDEPQTVLNEEVAEKDLQIRVSELKDLIDHQERYVKKADRELRELIDLKNNVDEELSRCSRQYDSKYLSVALELEKSRSALQQKLLDLKKLEYLVQRIDEMRTRVNLLIGEEQRIRLELREARSKAEADTQNLTRLKFLFLDCLLRSEIPGFLPNDKVEMKPPNFLPEITSESSGDLAVTSFSNLGSGGKKTLFKCCFAVAIHRLAVEIGASLPSILIIDSPMKNISERENRTQFEGFHKMLYELSQSELIQTQFILIDKEYCEPPSDYKNSFNLRHMKPDDDANPPLIRYYRGK